MAPNGTASRKTPAATPKPGKSEDSLALPNLFDDLETVRPKLKEDVRKALPVLEKPGSWESKVVGGTPQPTKDASQLNKIPSNLARAFPTGKLMADSPDVLKCTHCKRPVLKHAMPAHIERCLNKKQEKQRKKKEAKDARDAAARKEKSATAGDDESDDNGPDSASKTAGKNGGLTASKKRKAIDDAAADDAAPSKKKKKKDTAQAKAPRPKAPVDVEKQCGVELPQGGQCARSLTCKSHSMGAKRAVPGRSAPYDKLLNEYQRKNAAKIQKAAFDANAPNPEDEEGGTAGPVDPEEEKEAVMAGIGRAWGGTPLYTPPQVPLQRKYQYNRIKGMLSSALGNRSGGGGLFGTGTTNGGGFFGAPPAPAGPIVDADGIVHARRGSVVPGARSMMAPAASRKASVAPT